MTDLTQQAIAILRRNDRGGYTVPTNGLYPYQWNWDSAFVALGFAEFDRNRAWQEIETLLSGQYRVGPVDADDEWDHQQQSGQVGTP